MTKATTSLTIYSTTHCSDCRRTYQFLDKYGVPYEVIDIEQDAAAMKLVEQLNRGYQSVPTIIFPDGSTLTEPSYAQLAEKLGIPFGSS